MAPTSPSVASVARGRYWLRTLLRCGGVVLIVVAAVRAVGWVIACMFSGEPLSFLTLYDFWVALAPVPVAAVLILTSERIARWIMPMPRPVCPECGYALQPATDRCPECGLRTESSVQG